MVCALAFAALAFALSDFSVVNSEGRTLLQEVLRLYWCGGDAELYWQVCLRRVLWCSTQR